MIESSAKILLDNDTKRESAHYSVDHKFRSIKEWNADDRPREKLLSKGSDILSDSELLAILLATGTKNLSAIDCARMLLKEFEGIDSLSTRTIGELKKVKGIGEAKAITLMAAFELARRIKPKKFDQSKVISHPQDIADIYIPRLKDELQETFRVIHLNSANVMIREKVITRGILNASLVHPREVFRDAITEAAASIVLMHNHPSGNPKPSHADISITKQLKSAGEIMDIKVLDHIIIAGDSFTSLADHGYL
jgi:DNA repair protein RadC